MSQELTKARKRLGAVKSLLKQGKPMAAGQAVAESVATVIRSPLMKSEREEFITLIETAVYNLNGDDELRRHYSLVIKYTPGEEKVLLNSLNDLLKAFQDQMTEDAQMDIAEIERRKAEALGKGEKHLADDERDQAKALFDQLVKEFPGDSNLMAAIADQYLSAGMYKEAYVILAQALKDDPSAIFLYNRIGIALRKLKDYETAEKYYKSALELSKKDEYLIFNLGRLYFDMGEWKKMAAAAERALAINPDFKEAAKMLQFARKKMG